MKKYELYLDEDDVQRGYYVYLHKARSTGEVFYVGKGSGKRAWDKKKRNSDWQAKVNKLNNEWDVEIYEDDLTEIKAYQLEEKLVQDFGFFDKNNNQLTNRFPGGDSPASFSIGVSFEKPEEQIAYEKSKKFKNYDKSIKLNLAVKLLNELTKVYDSLWKLDSDLEYDENLPDEEIDFLPGSIIGGIEDALEAAKDFPKNRISWQSFCLDVEYSYLCITDKCYDQNEKRFTKEVYVEYSKALKALSHVYYKIETNS